MTSKPKVAFYWCASCGGCEEAVVDLAAGLLTAADALEIVFWPVALDFKYSHVEAMADSEIAVSFINGAIRTSEQEHVAKLLRKKSGLMVAFGACATLGGIPALANLTSKRAIFDRAYLNSPSVVNEDGKVPNLKSRVDGVDVELPEFYETVYKLDDVIEVDYYLPGCPPTSQMLLDAVQAILAGELPPKGSVLGPNRSLCTTCDRNDSKPDNVCIDRIRRVVDTVLDDKTCFLAQGVVCMGPATRGGCSESCVNGNMPCTGCFGPLDNCKDQGAKMIATLGGILKGDDPGAVEGAIEALVDPAGTFYRYGVSASMLGGRREEGD